MSDDLKDHLVGGRLSGLLSDPSEQLPDLRHVPLAPERGKGHRKIDFEKIKSQLAANIETIASRYLPNGKRVGKHWCTGDIFDKQPGADGGSLKLDLDGEHAGKWQDFATGEIGDLLDLIQRREQIEPAAAIEFCELQGWLSAPLKSGPAQTSQSKEVEASRAKAQLLWANSQPLDGTVGETYLQTRGLTPSYGPHLRFHAKGTSGHPSLVAAFVMPETGEITAVQTTALMADGSGKAGIKPPRRTIGSPEGAGIVVQANPTATKIVMAEGVETALSLRAAAPDAEIVAYGPKNNLVNASIDPRFTHVLIAADQDAPKEVEKLADKLRCTGKQVRVIFPATADANVRKGYDFNDLLREKGAEAVTEQLNLSTFSATASALAAPKLQRGRFEARPFSEIPDSTTGKFLVKGLLPANGLFCLFGAPGSGKSFVTHDLSIAVASGQDFAGRETQQGLVVSLAGEGEFGLKRRLLAAAQERGCPAALEKVWSIPGPFDMAQDGGDLNKSLLEIQARAGEPIRLVTIDTLSQTFGAGDQDKARDMQAWLNGVSMMTLGLGEVLVGTVHHGGWAEDRERGSTALRGAVDLMIKLKRDESRLTLTPVKNLRDGEPWEPFSLDLVETYLPGGESTLTIRNTTGASTTRPGPKPGRGKRKFQILAALSTRPMNLIELTDAMPCSSQASNLKTLKAMVDKQLIAQEGDLYRLKA